MLFRGIVVNYYFILFYQLMQVLVGINIFYFQVLACGSIKILNHFLKFLFHYLLFSIVFRV